MQESTLWQRASRRGKIIISLFSCAPLILLLVLALVGSLLPTPTPIQQYPCRNVAVWLAEAPAADGEYKLNASFEYEENGEWKKGEGHYYSTSIIDTYHTALAVKSEVENSEKPYCIRKDGEWLLGTPYASVPLSFHLLFFSVVAIVWATMILFLVHASRDTRNKGVLGALALMMGLCGIVLLVDSTLASRATSHWVAVRCEVDFFNYTEKSRANLRYQYNYENQQFEGSQLYPPDQGTLSCPSPKLAKILNGKKDTLCYVNPDDPKQSALEKTDISSHLLWLFPLTVCALTIYLLLTMNRRLSWQPRNPRQSVAFFSSAILGLTLILAWLTPGMLALLAHEWRFCLVFFALGLGCWAVCIKKLMNGFSNLGLNRPKITFNERPVEQGKTYKLKLEFLDKPASTSVFIRDGLGSVQSLLVNAEHESEVEFIWNYTQGVPFTPVNLFIATQKLLWVVPLIGEGCLFETSLLESWNATRLPENPR